MRWAGRAVGCGRGAAFWAERRLFGQCQQRRLGSPAGEPGNHQRLSRAGLGNARPLRRFQIVEPLRFQSGAPGPSASSPFTTPISLKLGPYGEPQRTLLAREYSPPAVVLCSVLTTMEAIYPRTNLGDEILRKTIRTTSTAIDLDSTDFTRAPVLTTEFSAAIDGAFEHHRWSYYQTEAGNRVRIALAEVMNGHRRQRPPGPRRHGGEHASRRSASVRACGLSRRECRPRGAFLHELVEALFRRCT
jgi:hypothetical protein